ncbi:MAG: hypothetical protein A2Y33_13150 [Spirochaetes bacterium GWF1_51_8]|nr:MAG: hypothetical protein A2Y33_13150 [Spirochaetes bacterium GWF1_51_8]
MKRTLFTAMLIGMGITAFLYAGEQYTTPDKGSSGKKVKIDQDDSKYFLDEGYYYEENVIGDKEEFVQEWIGETAAIENAWSPLAGSIDGKYVTLKLKESGDSEKYLILNVWTKKAVDPSALGKHGGDDKKTYSLDEDYFSSELYPVKYSDFYIDYKVSPLSKSYSSKTDLLSFYMVDPATGFQWKVWDKTSPVSKTPYPYGGKNTVSKMYMSHNADYYVVIYTIGANQKYSAGAAAAGSEGFLVLNSYDMSRFYNGVGYRFYKMKQYKKALDRFLMALSFDSQFVLALYNTACMYALMKNPVKSVEYLWELRKLGSKEAWEKLSQLQKDPDFNAIRKTDTFKKFIATVW